MIHAASGRRLNGFNAFAILLIGFVWIFETSAVAPILGTLGKDFPEASTFQLELVSTIVFFTSVIFSVVAGFILQLGWRYCFLAFAIVLVIDVVAYVGLPPSPPSLDRELEAQAEAAAHLDPAAAAKRRMPPIVWGFGAAMVVIWSLFQVNILNTSFVVLDELHMAPWTVGIAIALPGFASIFSGITFPFVLARFGGFTAALGLGLFAAGFVVLIGMNSYLTLCIGDLLFGYGQGLLVPLLLHSTAQRTLPEQRDTAYGIVSSCIHLGIFMTPLVQLLVAAATGSHALPVFYIVAAVGLGVACVVSLLLTAVRRSRPSSAAPGSASGASSASSASSEDTAVTGAPARHV